MDFYYCIYNDRIFFFLMSLLSLNINDISVLEMFSSPIYFKMIITGLAILSAFFVITSTNPILSLFNLIVLYIIIAFYLIFIGITYLGISYIVVYIGAIAILFLFIIMMIDIEVTKERSSNYLPLLLLMLGGFLWTIKTILFNIGIMKINKFLYKEKTDYLINSNEKLTNLNSDYINDDKVDVFLTNVEEIIKDSNPEVKLDEVSNISAFESIRLSEPVNILNKENNVYVSKLMEKIYNNQDNILNSKWSSLSEEGYLLITPTWDSALNRLTQISSIGDVLYTVYHAYIYIVSIILLLAMVGAIILTSGYNHHIKILYIEKNKNSNIFSSILFLNSCLFSIFKYIYNIFKKFNSIYVFKSIYVSKSIYMHNIALKIYKYIFKAKYDWVHSTFRLLLIMSITDKTKKRLNKSIFGFFTVLEKDYISSESILGNLNYYLISNLVIGLLLLVVNTYFSLSVKYLDKGGGFECGFTSFIQTRERFNVIFYRVSLLFLIFDLEIILIFPFTALYLKNQNNAKNNVLAFLYILVVGFIYELKEGALNIVKTMHSTEININNLLKLEPIYKNDEVDNIKANQESHLFLELVDSYHKQTKNNTPPVWI